MGYWVVVYETYSTVRNLENFAQEQSVEQEKLRGFPEKTPMISHHRPFRKAAVVHRHWGRERFCQEYCSVSGLSFLLLGRLVFWFPRVQPRQIT